MKYMGSKNRYFKYIQPFIYTEGIYIEPFVGGANVIDKLNSASVRIGADIDEDLIILWQAVSEGWIPPKEVSYEQYIELKTSSPSPLKSYAAFSLSYAGKKWGGWRRDSEGKRNYVLEAYKNSIKQFPLLRGAKFIQADYKDLYIPNNSTVYCDPPYKGTTKYKSGIDYSEFYSWCRGVRKHSKIYISEYNMPDDFVCVWGKEVASSLEKDTGNKKAVEKLWTLQ